jgi:hypothetical protein
MNMIAKSDPIWDRMRGASAFNWVMNSCGYALYRAAYMRLRTNDYFIIDDLLYEKCLPQHWRITTRAHAISQFLATLAGNGLVYRVRNKEYSFNPTIADLHKQQHSPFVQHASSWQLHGPRIMAMLTQLPSGQFTLNELVDQLDWSDSTLQSRASRLTTISVTKDELLGRGVLVEKDGLYSRNAAIPLVRKRRRNTV